MKSFINKFLLLITFFMLTVLSSFALEPVKVNGLIFDNSDNLIFLDTKGTIDNSVTFSKGTLKEPDRIYLDINNAILTTPKKTYTAKYSGFNNVKISQFTVEPKTVRIVFEYNKKLDVNSLKVLKTKDSIFIKTNKTLVDNSSIKTVYSNSKASDRKIFFEGATFNEVLASTLTPNEILISANPQNEILADLQITKKEQEPKTNSKFYIDSITKTNNGILINGLGKLSIIPPFELTEPDRLIIDIDDAVVSPELRNKTYPINQAETIKFGQNSQSIARIVIQGTYAKNYRGIISPDSKSLYLTDRKNIIETKMADTNANLVNSSFSEANGIKTAAINFTDSVAFNVFEENSNLYIDINNINLYQDSLLEPLKKGFLNFQTVRIASDKLRLIFPNISKSSFSVKTDPDNTTLRIYVKNAVQKPVQTTTPKAVLVPTKTVQVKKPTQISNYFTVVIDAGHGGSDVGATRNNIYEKDITLKISKMVEENLKDKNVKVYMVRDRDKTVSLAERCDFSNEKKPNLFVSIHVNSSTNEEIIGVETHWYKEDSRQYAEFVHREMQKKIKKWNTVDRGLFNSKFYVINHTDAPAILCEIGFISNKDERDEIIKTKRQEEIAEAIANGIYNYLKAKK